MNGWKQFLAFHFWDGVSLAITENLPCAVGLGILGDRLENYFQINLDDCLAHDAIAI